MPRDALFVDMAPLTWNLCSTNTREGAGRCGNMHVAPLPSLPHSLPLWHRVPLVDGRVEVHHKRS
jgi:hypothetical protein